MPGQDFSRSADRDAHDYEQASAEQKARIEAIRKEAEKRKERMKIEQARTAERDVQEQAGRLKAEPHHRPFWHRTSRKDLERRAALEVSRKNAEALALVDIDAARQIDAVLDEVRREKGLDRDREALRTLTQQKQGDKAATSPERMDSRQAPRRDAGPNEAERKEDSRKDVEHDGHIWNYEKADLEQAAWYLADFTQGKIAVIFPADHSLPIEAPNNARLYVREHGTDEWTHQGTYDLAPAMTHGSAHATRYYSLSYPEQFKDSVAKAYEKAKQRTAEEREQGRDGRERD